MRRIEVLLTGDVDHPQLADARRWLARRTQLTVRSQLADAVAWLRRRERCPFAVVIAQSRPGQFSSRHVEQLHAAAPLARLVGLLGSWCEGEGRSGRPWPGVVRLYWHQWPGAAGRQLELATSRRPDSWALPRTAAAEERLLFDLPDPMPQPGGVIGLYSQLGSAVAALADACSCAGYSIVRLDDDSVAPLCTAAAIWDGATIQSDWESNLHRLCRRVAPAPVLALLDFPRPQDRRRALAAGAVEVLGKPLVLSQLFWHLGCCIGLADGALPNAAAS